MNTRKRSLLRYSVTAICGLMLARDISAQTFTTLHSFTGGNDGEWPYSGLILSSNILYGTTYFEEMSATLGVVHGTAFAVSTDGRGFTNLHSFSPFNVTTSTNSDGNGPSAGLTLSGNTLYGTAALGGNSGNGTVFAVNTDGTGFTVLHTFNGSSDGSDPNGGLILSDSTLYGTAAYGGSSNAGTVFALSINGTGFTVLHDFTGGNDGGWPYSTLVLSSNTVYGTASFGGVNSGNGTVFALSTDGTGFTVLHTFTEPLVNGVGVGTNSDGAEPRAGVILSRNTLYGVGSAGGSGGGGTVFALTTDGTGFTTLHNFPKTTRPSTNSPINPFPLTNSDGAFPHGGLILSGNTLYGAAADGGSRGNGTLFAINTDGTGFTVLRTFDGGDGSGPNGGLVLRGNTMYGTTMGGGSSGRGTVFSISFSPKPTITPSVSGVILSWPTNYAGFDYTGYHLQSTANLSLPIWTTNLPAPVVVNGQYTISNLISGTQQFFTLAQ